MLQFIGFLGEMCNDVGYMCGYICVAVCYLMSDTCSIVRSIFRLQ